MSFSSNIKDELIKIEDMPECCVHAMAYGMLLFGRSFNSGGISVMTDHHGVADKYIAVTQKACSVTAEKSVSDAGKITVDVPDKADRDKILSSFSSRMAEREILSSPVEPS